jgi:hypothetical protein
MADQTRWNENRNRGVYGYGYGGPDPGRDWQAYRDPNRDPGWGQTFGREYGGRPYSGPHRDRERRPPPIPGEGGYGSGYGGYQGSYAPVGGAVGRFGSDMGRRGMEGGQAGFGSSPEDRRSFAGPPQPNQRGVGPRNYQRSDERIREDVFEALTDDAILDASDIQVEVRNGEVTLSGSVANREDKRRADDIANDTSGVRHVENGIRVEREGRAQYGSSAGARAGWIGGGR